MAEIHLTGGGVALIDDEDADRIPLSGWWRCRNGYANRHTPMVGGKRAKWLLHRLIIDAPKGYEVDHVNHDKLDCRKSNLRVVTKSQNMQNRSGADRRNRVGVRGVITYRTKSGPRFRAAVEINGQSVQRWGLKTLEEAIVVVTELRRVHFTHSSENVSGW